MVQVSDGEEGSEEEEEQKEDQFEDEFERLRLQRLSTQRSVQVKHREFLIGSRCITSSSSGTGTRRERGRRRDRRVPDSPSTHLGRLHLLPRRRRRRRQQGQPAVLLLAHLGPPRAVLADRRGKDDPGGGAAAVSHFGGGRVPVGAGEDAVRTSKWKLPGTNNKLMRNKNMNNLIFYGGYTIIPSQSLPVHRTTASSNTP